MEYVIRNVLGALSSACENLRKGLYALVIEECFLASELIVKLLCEWAFKRGFIAKLPVSHRGRQNALTILHKRGLVPHEVVSAYSEVMRLRERGVYALKNGDLAKEMLHLSYTLVKDILEVLGVRVVVEECKGV